MRCTSRRISRRSHAACAALAACLALAAGPAATALAAPRLPRNITAPALPIACDSAPHGAVCENAVIAALDAARVSTGLRPYRLPKDFLALAPDRQLFVLANLDRIAEALPPVPALVSELDAAAVPGAVNAFDPAPPAGFFGGTTWGWGSSWARGFVNALAAYYFWMYDDGYPGGNVSCHSATDPGCWDHRGVVLWAIPAGHVLSMGIATVRRADGRPGYAMLIVVSNASQPPPASYTWAAAQADGAGTFAYDPTPPRLGETRLVRARIRARERPASFRFSASAGARRFGCALVRQPGRAHGTTPRLRFSACRSSKTYRRLPRGRYRFYVRASGPDGPDPTPAGRSFAIG